MLSDSLKKRNRRVWQISLPVLLVALSAPVALGQTLDFRWNVNGNGAWTVGTNWDQGTEPNDFAHNAILLNPTVPTSAVVVTFGPSITRSVHDLTLEDTGDPTKHELLLANAGVLQVEGDVFNDGVIRLRSAGSFTRLRAVHDNLTLNGGGRVTLDASISTNNVIDGSLGAGFIINSSTHTIDGAGQIGANTIGINNQGTIDANLLGLQLTVDPDANNALNSGTMRASNGGILILGLGNFDNTGGVIQALADSTVQLNGATVTGGTLQSSGTGFLEVPVSAVAAVSDLSLAGRLIVRNNADLTLGGAIDNQGVMEVASSGSTTEIIVSAAGVTLTGGGKVQLGTGTSPIHSRIDSTGLLGTLTNVDNTIEGRGNVGTNSTGLINQTTGLIDANLSGESLIVDPLDVDGMTNTGTMQASNGGLLVLTGAGFNNAGGLIQALDLSKVVLSNATITGGTLQTTGTGLIETLVSDNSNLTDVTIVGRMVVQSGSDLNLSGMIDNQGTIEVASAGGFTDLEIAAAGATLTGGGTVKFGTGSNATNSRVDSTTLLGTLTNVDNTLEGRGNLGSNTTGLVNQATGMVDANLVGNTLMVDPLDAAGMTNTGTMRASDGGILQLVGPGFNNTSGIIQALDGSKVVLQEATITGGTLQSTGTGLLETLTSDNSNLADLTIDGRLVVNNASDLNISGTIHNQGTIELASSGSNTDLEIAAGGATLTGGGMVRLGTGTSATAARIDSAGAGGTLTNVDNIIEGRGSVGANTTGLINQTGGLFDANRAGDQLIVDPHDVLGIINTGVMQASNGGTLRLLGPGFDNNGGLIHALDGSTVLLGNTSIVGGTLQSSGSGFLQTPTSDNSNLADLTIDGRLVVNNASDLNISGTIHNQGTIELASNGSNTDLEIPATGAILTGGGTVRLGTGTSATVARVDSAGFSGTLTNINNTIEGRGNIGTNTTGLVNQAAGLIHGNQTGFTLTIDPNAAGLQNQGTVRSSNGATVTLAGGGDVFTNDGTFEVFTDSVLNTSGGSTLTNASAGVLTGGTYRSVTTGGASSMQFASNAAVTQVAGPNTVVELSGANAAISFGGASLASSLATNDGTLRILDGHTFTMTNALTNNGVVELGGLGLVRATLDSAGAITNSASGEVFGHGTISDTILNSGLVRAANGTLDITGGVIDGQSGTIQIDPGAVLDLSGASGDSDTDNLYHNGLGLALGSNNILVRNDYDNSNFGVGNSFDPRADVSGSGLILADPAVQQTLGGDVTDGATPTATMAFGNLRVGTNASLAYQVNNVGASGPMLRTAIQTDNSAGNGGNITDLQLSGAGVSSQNLPPISVGDSSAALSVNYSPTVAGPLVGQQVAIVNNFDNVGEQILQITGAAYNSADPLLSPTAVNLGNFHVGDAAITPQLSVTNAAPVGPYSEDLLVNNLQTSGDAGIVSSNTGVAVPAGASSDYAQANIDTSTAGAKAGTVTIDMYSNATVNGAPIAGLSPLALGQGNVAINATVYRLAEPAVSSPLHLGDFHVGDLAQGNPLVANAAANDGFSENLEATVTGFSGDVSSAGGTSLIAPQADSAGDLSAELSTAAAGARIGTVSIDLTSKAIATGLSDTTLPPQDVTVSANVYNLAQAQVLNLQPIDFGIVHVGDVVPQIGLNIKNDAPAAFSENLNAMAAAHGVGVVGGGSFNGLAPQAVDNGSLQVGIVTNFAMNLNSTYSIDLVSDGTGVNSLGQTPLGTQSVPVIAQINNFAAPEFAKDGGDGMFTQIDPLTYSIDFGTYLVGSPSPVIDLGLLNDTFAPADSLAGSFAMTGAGFNFANFAPFAGILAGDTLDDLLIGLDTNTVGMHFGQLVLSPRSQNASGFDGALQDITIHLTGIVNVPEPASIILLAIGLTALLFTARRRRALAISVAKND